MATRGGDADAASYESSSSASSDDGVIITKTHRKKLQLKQHSQRYKLKTQTNQQPPPTPMPTPTAAAPGTSKPDHICGVCEREGEGGDLVVCSGSCVSAFHRACLSLQRDGDSFRCPSCVTGTHRCFHCKQLGVDATGDANAQIQQNQPLSPATEELRPVVKCRALSCGKFYHQSCIAKLPLARIAGARFICPLHTCAACEQSGAKKEPVRCTRCPVAYHTSCLPRSGVTPLPGKRIICPKHEGEAAPAPAPPPSSGMTTAPAGREELHREVPFEEKPPPPPPPVLQRVASAESMSVAASSPRTEENDDDARSDTSKKPVKSSKKDKKKKKKKRKKDKRRSGKDDEKDDARKSKKASKSSKGSEKRSGGEDGEQEEQEEQQEEEDEDKKVAVPASEEEEEEEEGPKSAVVKKEKSVASPAEETKQDKVTVGEVQEPAEERSSSRVKEEETEQQRAYSPPETQRPETTAPAEQDEERKQVHSPARASSPLPIPSIVAAAVAVHEELQAEDASLPTHERPPRQKPEESVQLQSHARDEETVTRSSALPLDHHVEEESHEKLRVQIPQPTALGGKDTTSDGGDDSGSGSQSARARSSSARNAAEVAKEKLSSGGGGGGGSSSRSKKSKKKRKGKGDDGGDGEKSEIVAQKEEAKWVQCDACKKWRTVAKEIDLDAMPDTWYCTMNSWNMAVAACEVPEEVVETKKLRSSKRASATSEVGTPAPKKTKLAKQTSASDAPAAADAAAAAGAGGAAAAGADASAAAAADKGDKAASKVAKKADKDSKKRKLKLKLKEKYGEVNWVQCDNKSCGKWRVVPSSASSLPTSWYCSLNTWAPELASCSAANPPEVEAYLSKSQSKKPSSTRPAKRLKSSDSAQDLAALPSTQSLEGGAVAKPPSSKPGKGVKSSTPTAHASGAAGLPLHGGAAAAASSSSHASAAAAGDGRGKVAITGVKSVVLEWAQCEKCLKWRKLPAHVKSSTLPDKWYCSMNHWDPSRASCALPQEEDQEPVDASPLPSSQNWYPMPGQVGAGSSSSGGAVRSKRGKLSYSELLYASTGQLRKTYTSDSSTLSFEYEGVTYHRDDQYRKSSMYVSPLTTNKISGEQFQPQADATTKLKDALLQFVAPSMQQLVDRVAKVVLSKMDLRRDFAITEIVDSVLHDADADAEADATSSSSHGELSLNVITLAVAQLVATGELEKVDRSSNNAAVAVVHSRPSMAKRGGGGSGPSCSASVLLASLSSQPALYRKVPRRPLKALKAWKLAAPI